MMTSNQILLTNIQRFSLHDGPGIRTTVFLKGCSLRCPWCSNPENLDLAPQDYIKDGLSGTYGKYYTPVELIKECLKDKNFYEGKLNVPTFWNITDASNIERLPGGVTFSGGEALLQIESLVPVIKTLHKSDIHVVVETSLFCSKEQLKLALEHIDFFYVDVKILDFDRCKTVEHGNLGLYLSNLDTLLKNEKPVVLRIPVIGSYTDSLENRTAIHDLLSKYREHILKVELIKEHNLGEAKYNSLKMTMDYHGVDDELMETYKEELNDLGILIEVCKT